MRGLQLTVLLFLLGIVCGIPIDNDLRDRYDFQLDLEFQQEGATPLQFFYTYDRENETLKMAVKVQNLGWVGIGLSPNAFMPDTDVVIGWVDESGRGFLQVSSQCKPEVTVYA